MRKSRNVRIPRARNDNCSSSLYDHPKMEPHVRAQVRLILEHHLDLVRNEFHRRIKVLQAANASKGLLRSGATIRAAIRIMEDLAAQLVKDATDQVIAVTRDRDAFALIQEALSDCQGFLRSELDPIVCLSTGHTRDSRQSGSAYREADRLFADQEMRTSRQLELHRFSFIQRLTFPAVASVHQEQRRQNPGGRPLARHWDEMWAAIAVMLYVGDLKPATQADIEAAMKDWLADHNLEVGDTPVRERARALWQRLEAAE